MKKIFMLLSLIVCAQGVASETSIISCKKDHVKENLIFDFKNNLASYTKLNSTPFGGTIGATGNMNCYSEATTTGKSVKCRAEEGVVLNDGLPVDDLGFEVEFSLKPNFDIDEDTLNITIKRDSAMFSELRAFGFECKREYGTSRRALRSTMEYIWENHRAYWQR